VTGTSLRKRAELTDAEKSAVVLLSIGQDAAAEVMKHLSPMEISLLSATMSRISSMPKTAIDAVFQEFVDLMLEEASFGGGEDYLRGVLEKALGAGRAERFVSRLKQGDYFAGIEAVQVHDPRALAEMIGSEHPQVVAMLFAYLEPDQVDALIGLLPPDLIEQVIPRLATLDTIPAAAVRELNESIEDMLAGAPAQQHITVGGVNIAAKILTRIDAGRADTILQSIGSIDEELAQRLADSMFTFEDLEGVDDRYFQMLLREVDQNILVVALKGADRALQEKVLRNLSQRASAMLRDEMASRGPMRIAEVEAAKREVIAAAQRLEREGKIILRSQPGEILS
jgi:flagellar motor switch protein FliG